tara:strand:- start:920 stop:1063 length:144 start_codon:yes stop_codon:yes gene_type:complete
MSINQLPHNGAWVVSDIIDNHLVTRTYHGYTREEAVTLFDIEVRKNE